MRKNLLLLSLLIAGLSFMAFKFMIPNETNCKMNVEPIASNQEFMTSLLDFSYIADPEDLLYKVESRFLATISKSDLDKAKTIIDILPRKATNNIKAYNYSRVSILDDHIETDRRAIADNEILTTAQINLIQSTNDSGNIYIRSDYENNNGLRNYNYLTYFISVVPDQQAFYNDGYASLINYLKTNSAEEVKVITKDGLKGGKVQFTITKEGLISNVSLTSTSGYTSVDKVLVETIENIPGEWTPASNGSGEKVDQEYVFFFGIEGC